MRTYATLATLVLMTLGLLSASPADAATSQLVGATSHMVSVLEDLGPAASVADRQAGAASVVPGHPGVTSVASVWLDMAMFEVRERSSVSCVAPNLARPGRYRANPGTCDRYIRTVSPKIARAMTENLRTQIRYAITSQHPFTTQKYTLAEIRSSVAGIYAGDRNYVVTSISNGAVVRMTALTAVVVKVTLTRNGSFLIS